MHVREKGKICLSIPQKKRNIDGIIKACEQLQFQFPTECEREKPITCVCITQEKKHTQMPTMRL